MNNALVILRKEWLEVRKQPLLLISIIVPSIIFTVLPLFVLGSGGALSRMKTSTSAPPGVQTPLELALMFSALYLLLPGIITSVISSYSIVGEKTSRTLEPLLATPVRTWELLLGKCLASLLPGVGVTWLSALLFLIGASLMNPLVVVQLLGSGWLIVVLLWAPLLAIIAIAAMIAISSRVNEPRTAQQASAWLIVPFLATFFSQMAGLQVFGVMFDLLIAAVLLGLAVLALWLTTFVFQRETILTRWK